MSLNVIVCDDSKFARNQLIKILPKRLIKNLYQANNGAEAMQLIRDGKGDLIFLDLNMPIMDGYQVLEAIKQENLDILKIVVSGDIQQQAQQIISQYNVLEFVKKPIQEEFLKELLLRKKICSQTDFNGETIDSKEYLSASVTSINTENQFDELKEKFNVATGQAASKLADILNLFITMPLPIIKIKKGKELATDIKEWLDYDGNILISQGFVGSNRIIGESLVFFSNEDIEHFTHYIGSPKSDYKEKLSLILELSGLLSGTLMRGFLSQLNATLNLTHPANVPNIENNLSNEELSNTYILCVELIYEIKDLNMQIKFNVLFTQKSSEKLREIMAFI
ncbi:MAG: response regulator [Succinivibrionaceae bacterium]